MVGKSQEVRKKDQQIKVFPKKLKLKKTQRLYRCPVPIIGITGGIASGKTSFSLYLQQKGAVVINADQLVKEIYQSRKSHAFIRRNFPDAYDKNEKRILFPELRKIFFSQKKSKVKIENFILPQLGRYFRQKLKALPGRPSLIFFDQPILFEKKYHLQCDLSVLIAIPHDLQIKRLMKRDKIGKSLALKIIRQQISIQKKKKDADLIIDNSGTPAQLEKKAEQLLLLVGNTSLFLI